MSHAFLDVDEGSVISRSSTCTCNNPNLLLSMCIVYVEY